MRPALRFWFLGSLAVAAMAAESTETGQSPWQRLRAAVALEDPGEARTALERLLDDRPDFLAARYNLGVLLAESEGASAADHLAVAMTSTNHDLAAQAAWNLALLRHRQGRHQEALAAAEEALRLVPDSEAYQAGRNALRQHLLATEDALRLAREAAAKRLRLADTPLPAARIDRPYETTLTAIAGGGPPYRFAAGDEGLPDGLQLAADGTLAGTPTKAGRATIAVVLEDGAGGRETDEATLLVRPPATITTRELPPAVAGQLYRAVVLGSGLAAPSWAVEGLPDGLTATAEGLGVVIAGIPVEAGDRLVDVTVVDDDGAEATATFQLRVDDAFAPAERQLPPATAWHGYRARMTVRGPDQAYRWRSTGANGLSVAEDGTVSGLPDRAGTLELPVTIAAEDGRERQAVVLVPVNPPPVITTEEALTWQTGTAIDEELTAEGGTPELEWSLGGEPPPGTRLEDGRLTGVPTMVGTWELPLELVDHWGARADRTITVTVEENEDGRPDGEPESQQGDQQQQQDQEGDQQQSDDQGEQDQQQEQDGDQQQGEHGDQQQEPQPDGQGEQQQQQSGDQQGEQQQEQEQDDGQGERNDQQRQADQQRQDGLSRSDAQRWLEGVLDEEEDRSRDALRRLFRGATPAGDQSNRGEPVSPVADGLPAPDGGDPAGVGGFRHPRSARPHRPPGDGGGVGGHNG